MTGSKLKLETTENEQNPQKSTEKTIRQVIHVMVDFRPIISCKTKLCQQSQEEEKSNTVLVRCDAYDLAVDGCPPCQSVLLGLHDDHAGALAHDKASPVLVERPGSALGVVVEGGHHGPHGAKPGEAEWGHGCLGAPGDHHIRLERNETEQNKTKRNGTERNGTKRNEMKQNENKNETRRNKPKQATSMINNLQLECHTTNI